MSTPFFAPSYFAPAYFGGLGAVAPVVTPLPYGLADAVVALIGASPSLAGEDGFTKLYRDKAGNKCVLPYLIYSIKRGAILRKTDVSTWHDDRITFRAWASSGDLADQLAQRVRRVIEPDGVDGIHLFFQTGSTAPLYETDRSEGSAVKRGPDAVYEYYSSVEYSARNLSRGGV